MERTPLNSRVIASAGYDAQKNILEIEFRRGAVYHYFDVPQSVFDWLLKVPSKSAFLERNIKGHYDYQRLGGRRKTFNSEDEALLALLQASIKDPVET